MSHHRGKSTGRPRFKAQGLLDIFMKKFHRPAEPVSEEDLARRSSPVTTGPGRAATFRSRAPCGAHPWALPARAQRAHRVAEAPSHALVLGALRGATHGWPLSPAVMTQAWGHGAPRPGRGRRQGERCRRDTARVAPSAQARPTLLDQGLLA